VTPPVYRMAGIPKATWYRWIGTLILADKDPRGHYKICPRERHLLWIAGILHRRLGICAPQLAPLLGRLREMSAPERDALLDNLVIVQTGRRTFSFHDHIDAVPQIRPLAIYPLVELRMAALSRVSLGGTR